jgi:flagellin-like protein
MVKGVSPVAATVILVAITVMSAAAIGYYLTALRPGALPPNVSFEVHLYDNLDEDNFLENYTFNEMEIINYNWYFNDNDYMSITHTGGDPILLDETLIYIRWAGGPAGTTRVYTRLGLERSDPLKENIEVWDAGTELKIRLVTDAGQPDNTARYYQISQGQPYEISVFHSPTRTTIFRAIVVGEQV